MSPETALGLAQAVLLAHLAAIFFIIFGLITIPLGAWLGWGFVHGFGWRLLHLVVLGLVAVQKLFGGTCFLTVWEDHLLELARHASHGPPLINVWGDRLIYVDLPMSFFVTLYTALWIYVIVLWFRVPPHRGARRGKAGGT